MRTLHRITTLFLLICTTFCFSACGSQNEKKEKIKNATDIEISKNSISEDYFEWSGNIITGLTEAGVKQKVLIIPARCEGFEASVFAKGENVVKEVSFESDKDINLNGAFRLAEIEKIVLPEQLTNIQDLEFWCCPNLKSIIIPSSVLKVGDYAFQENKALSRVDFSGGAVEIGMHAFEGCTSLNEIIFSDLTTTIGEYAFWKCQSLKVVRLPEALNTIGKYVFSQTALDEIYVPSMTELISYKDLSFVETDHTVNTYVVEGSWYDTNFNNVFGETYEKKYIEK